MIVHTHHLSHSPFLYHLCHLDQSVYHNEQAHQKHQPQQTHRYHLVPQARLLVSAVEIAIILAWIDQFCLEPTVFELDLQPLCLSQSRGVDLILHGGGNYLLKLDFNNFLESFVKMSFFLLFTLLILDLTWFQSTVFFCFDSFGRIPLRGIVSITLILCLEEFLDGQFADIPLTFGEVDAFDMQYGGQQVDEAESQDCSIDINDDIDIDFQNADKQADDYDGCDVYKLHNRDMFPA